VDPECEAAASAPDPRKSAEVLGLDAERHAGASLRTQHLQYCVARRHEDLNLRRRVERLGVGLRGSPTTPMWNSIEAASGWTCTTVTSVRSASMYSSKASSRGHSTLREPA
jgi:hypothetical protein